MKKIGVIADTHGWVDPAAVDIFNGADLILHAGDVGEAGVIGGLESIARVVAVSGNHEDETTAKFNWIETLMVDEVKIALTHRFFPLNMEKVVNMPPKWQETMGLEGVRVMVFGHSHEPMSVDGGAVLYYNPGYAGPDMTEPLRTVGLLCIEGNDVSAETYFLSPPPRTEYLDKARFFNNFIEYRETTCNCLKK